MRAGSLSKQPNFNKSGQSSIDTQNSILPAISDVDADRVDIFTGHLLSYKFKVAELVSVPSHSKA